MKKKLTQEANSLPASQKISCPSHKRFYTMFNSHHWSP